jgi:hypothetical protein
MKATRLIIILLVLVPLYGLTAASSKDRKVNFKPSAVLDWRTDRVVNVYFVRNMFTVNERQMVWNALETWTQMAKKKGRELSFVAAGETGGLIDCADCLTIARSGYTTERMSQRASFNALRQDETGRLISAWIGFQHTGDQIDLNVLMLQALERGLSLPSLQAASGRR